LAGGHEVHLRAASWSVYDPARQAVQGSVSRAAKYPGVHAVKAKVTVPAESLTPGAPDAPDELNCCPLLETYTTRPEALGVGGARQRIAVLLR
jgi:hypothetical protein